MRQFSPYVSILGLVFSYWLTKFSGSKVPHGGSAHDRDLVPCLAMVPRPSAMTCL